MPTVVSCLYRNAVYNGVQNHISKNRTNSVGHRMALTQRLQMRQSQALVMTPQLMQAIKLLQLSNLDLAAYVEGELEKNPLLERAAEGEPGASTARAEPVAADFDGDGDAAGDGDGRRPDRREPGDQPQRHRGAARHRSRKRVSRRRQRSRAARRAPTQPAAYSDWASVGSGGREDGDYNLEAFVSAEPTLADHLAEQLALAIADPVRRMIGQYLIDMVDEAGYLTGDLAVGRREARRAARRGRSGARRSCRASIRRACARAISPNASRSSSRSATASIPRCRRWSAVSICSPSAISPALRRICGVGDEDLAEMIAEIRSLNPKPGLAFGSTMVQPIVPDVYVRPGPGRRLHRRAQLRHAAEGSGQPALPRRAVEERQGNDSAKTYLAENLQSATWLMRALDQRAKTILKVATEIVKQQDAFFVHGVQHLRPLNLKTIADAISMHESTVSRVTANKYIATNRGIFELKYFFTSSIAVVRRRRRAFGRSGAATASSS